MSRTTPRGLLLLGICAVLATGCGSSAAVTSTAPAASTVATPTPGPSALTLMVCGGSVRADIAAVLGRPTIPIISRTWISRLYSCTFQLPVGPLVLSVKESADPAAARAHYATTRRDAPAAKDTPGLGETAYLSPDGIVGLVKDNFTLTVDATGLPAEFGTEGQKRTDFAYEVATIVLGCWTEHG
jgi:hypothetical protein